jgi:hypothetical protein
MEKPAAKNTPLQIEAVAEDPDALVTYDQLKLPPWNIKFSRKHIRELCRKGLFEQPLEISANRIAWTVAALRRQIAKRKPRTYHERIRNPKKIEA